MTTGEDLAAALAREIRAAVAETAPAEPSAPGGPESDELADVHLPLKRAEQYLTPTIPDASRLAGVKAAAVRLLRFLWRGQSSFNALLLEAASGIVAGLERNSRAIDRAERRFEDLSEERNAWEKDARQRDSGQDTRIAYLEALSLRSSPASSAVAPEAPIPESIYALFEERFRGSPEHVAEKQKFYLPFLWNLPGPVFDAGCGRGEFLRLLKDQGIPSRGVDSSGLAAQTCRAAGLDVREGDAIDALAAASSGSLGGVVAFQVVEHWPAAATFRFLAEARRALAPGGVAIVETINTDSLAAMNAFYLDPTHVRPVPPEALRFLFDAVGFCELRVEYLAPLPASERLEERSANDARLNSVLFGPQDYAVIGWVPAA
ncbi:MAG TPA: class I SAM-dependent methyltransferase [Thermoanaerobaculia bacterium]|jgi:SAM-dependent methyltransferase|nr:class I SAM-dependent methyltransferase [Thermoanaerobaculia bacterium]